jgi:putative redox protein
MTPPSKVTAILGREAPDYSVSLSARQHALKGDEPPDLGGSDSGLRPFEFVLSGLASCTAITLRMYAQRKRWDLADVRVEVRLHKRAEAFSIERHVEVTGELSPEQRTRLADICERTPVTLLIKQGASIETTLR